MKPQTARVFNALTRSGWVCGKHLELPDVGGNRFGARICEIRDVPGVTIEKRVCRVGAHRHRTTMWQYRIVEPSVQMILEVAS